MNNIIKMPLSEASIQSKEIVLQDLIVLSNLLMQSNYSRNTILLRKEFINGVPVHFLEIVPTTDVKPNYVRILQEKQNYMEMLTINTINTSYDVKSIVSLLYQNDINDDYLYCYNELN